ncbi:MAG: hypothetical protein ACXAEN_24065, partial [Candidatus Thorarchaeota archaeon]
MASTDPRLLRWHVDSSNMDPLPMRLTTSVAPVLVAISRLRSGSRILSSGSVSGTMHISIGI